MQNLTKTGTSRLHSKFLTFLSVILFSLFSNAYGQLVWSGESSTETFGATSAWWSSTERSTNPWMVSIDNAFTFNGGSAWRFESRTGDHGVFDATTGPWRSQIAQGNPPNNETPAVRQYMSGNEFYYGFAVYFDPTYPDNRDWNQFAQWKTVAPAGWPELELDIDNYTPGNPQMVTLVNNQSLSGGSGTVLRRWTLHPFIKGVWHKYVVHIKHHPTTGFVEVWHGEGNGPMTVVLPLQSNIDTHNETNRPGHMGVGIYRAPMTTVPAIMWGDAYKCGYTYNDVVPTMTACGAPDNFVNTSFTAQTGLFTSEFDVVPTGPNLNGVVGLSNGAATDYPNLACIIRFNPTGQIDAMNGSVYQAASTINYSAGTSYRVKMLVNRTTKKYDIYVTPAGGSTILVGSQYNFRTEQINVTQLNNYSKATVTCNLNVTNFANSAIVCGTPDNFSDVSFTNQTGTFTTNFDVVVTGDSLNGVVGLSNGAATDYPNLACIIRFNPTGKIDARNGGIYQAASTIPYSKGKKYRVKMVVYLSTKKYDIYVTPEGGSQITVGTNYGFRTEQINVTQLNNYSKATITCNMLVTNFTAVAGIFRTSSSSSEVKGPSINPPVKASISFPGSEKAGLQEGGFIKIYPNPSKDYIIVNARVKSHSRVQMSIFDINGKLIWIRSYANSAEYLNERINVGNFVPGSYTLKFQENGRVTSKKLTIE